MRKTLPKTILIVLIIVAGVLWLIGASMDDVLSEEVTWISAGVFIVLFSLTVITGVISTHRREDLIDGFAKRRRTKIAAIEASGFVITRKFIGSSRMLAIDEEKGRWFLINYLYEPEEALVHDVRSITSLEQTITEQYAPEGRAPLLPSGKRMSKEIRTEYNQAPGIAIHLNEPDRPVEFVNCYKVEKDAEIIMKYLSALVERWKGTGNHG